MCHHKNRLSRTCKNAVTCRNENRHIILIGRCHAGCGSCRIGREKGTAKGENRSVHVSSDMSACNSFGCDSTVCGAVVGIGNEGSEKIVGIYNDGRRGRSGSGGACGDNWRTCGWVNDNRRSADRYLRNEGCHRCARECGRHKARRSRRGRNDGWNCRTGPSREAIGIRW